MLTPQELSRKVRQLDNDVQSIYEMLAGISATQQRQGNRLEEISERLELVAAEQAAQGNRLELVAAEQAAQGNRLEEILGILRRDRPQAT